MQVYNVRKLHFQANLCEAFAEDKNRPYCRELVLGWASLQKTVFNHSKQDFNQNVEEVLTCYIFTYIAQNLGTCLGIKDRLLSILTFDYINNKFKYIDL